MATIVDHLGEGDPQVLPVEQGQVGRIPRVEPLHSDHLGQGELGQAAASEELEQDLVEGLVQGGQDGERHWGGWGGTSQQGELASPLWVTMTASCLEVATLRREAARVRAPMLGQVQVGVQRYRGAGEITEGPNHCK